MSLDIDTQTIRRLRDALVAGGRVSESADGTATKNIDARSQASINRVSPFAETMYLMMMADGDASESERDAIRGALQVLTHGLLDRSVLDDILKRCEVEAREQGVEARLQAIGARLCGDRLDRETAFTLAAAVAMADDQVVEQESLLVESIAEWYGISARRCTDILQQL